MPLIGLTACKKIEDYRQAILHVGGEVRVVDPSMTIDDVFGSIDGLLLSGGADLDPARYGRPNQAAHEVEPGRDDLEAAAWAAAADGALPVLGVCRGLQAINVFSGGTLLQHVEGHAGPGWGTGSPAWMHPIRVEPASDFAELLSAGEASLSVNTYHHQGVREADLAPGLTPTAWADSPVGPIVEALEAEGERFVVGVQCHPERTEVTPPEMERLFRAFVEAAAQPAARSLRKGGVQSRV
jgi:putative glutamine amidotransferase